jgi:hypothetical protein
MEQQTTQFAQLPPNAEGHFRLLFYTAIFHLSRYLRRLSGLMDAAPLAPFPFLEGYVTELRSCVPEELEWDESLQWWREQAQAWEASCSARLPLRALAEHLSLSYEELITLMLAGLVEEDIRFGSLFAALQEPLVARRPCLGLLAALTADPARGSELGEAWQSARRLMDAGLVIAENQSAPRAEWILRVPPQLWESMRARAPQRLSPECTLSSRHEFPPLKELALDPPLHDRLRRLPAVLKRGQIGAVILRGMENSGRRTIMGSLARALRRDLLFYDRRTRPDAAQDLWPMMGALCALTGAFPVIALDPAPGETVEAPPLAGYHGPLGVIMRLEGGVSGPALEQTLTLTLPAPTPEHRQSIWRRSLGARADGDLSEIVDRFLLPLGNVHRAAGIATAYASLEGHQTVTPQDVQLACRSLNRQALDTLAKRLEVAGDWSDLIVNEVTAADLRDLELRCRHRERLLKHLGAGFHNSVNCGVRALFNGPSGTGKTLAAKILAAVLSMDIYRLDLASVVNKYIGETEKNLSQLLARAEELDVLLLIDEGDALMANRTDVKSANDRYANLETNYLLQRLETYQGIIVVTTNAGNRIDAAFQRRFDVVIEFNPPDPFERLLIWQQHLPAAHYVSSAYLQEIAQQCALTGGQIRNAALYAALLAVDVGLDEHVYDSDVAAAVQREYRKTGGSCPLNRPARANGHHAELTRFLEEAR